MKRLMLMICVAIALGMLIAACEAEKVEVTRVVTEKETIVEKETVIETVVQTVIEQETVLQTVQQTVIEEKEVVVTATPEPKPEHCTTTGGIVRMSASSGRTKYFSPLWFLGSVGWDSTMPHVWPTLIMFGPDGETTPYLAERYEFNETADAVTFWLPQDARWSDGVPVTAEDVRWTYETLLTPGFLAFTGGEWGMFPVEQLKGGKEFADGQADHISGIEVIDDKTVRFVLAEPNVTFVRGLWRPIAPAHLYEGDETFEEMEANPFTQNSTVHSGPFRLIQFSEDPQFVEIEAVHPYWVNTTYLHEACIDKFIMFQNLNAMQAVTKMEAGELEVRERPSAEALDRALRNPDIHLYTGPALSWGAFGVNGRNEYLQDKRVRQAFMYLIDRDVVNRLRFGDRAEGEGGGESIVSPIFAPQWAVNPNLNQYAHDPELARQMLEEAGWDFSRELVYQSFSAEEEDPLALYVQQAFADIGINVRIRKSAFSGFYDIFAEGDFDLWFEAGFDGAHPSTSVITFHCEAWNAKMAGFCNPEFDELLLKSASTIDEQEAKTIAWRMSEILNDELPWLWANRDPVNILVHDRLQNYVWTPVLDVSETWSILNWELK